MLTIAFYGENVALDSNYTDYNYTKPAQHKITVNKLIVNR